MESSVLLDAAVVTRCRRRVHLDNDPTMVHADKAPADPALARRLADTQAHREAVADRLKQQVGAAWVAIPADDTASAREQATADALDRAADFIWNAYLPRDRDAGRRGGADLLVRTPGGYVPVIVVRHKITDPGEGAAISLLDTPTPVASQLDSKRKVRPQPRDQLRLAHAYRMLSSSGYTDPDLSFGGVIGIEADFVLWHDLTAATWQGGKSTLAEYDARFADRLAIAHAAATSAPALALPSRIYECRSCPWWPICERELQQTRDVSLVVRGEDAYILRDAGIGTIDDLAALEIEKPHNIMPVGMPLTDAVVLARAWQRDLTVVRKVKPTHIPRADVEVDVDMESFGDSGAYLWGCLLSGIDIGEPQGYHPFVTWDPLPTSDEGRSFAEFWQWLTAVRARATERGLSFRAYCYNELAENYWLTASAERFADQSGIPTMAEVQAFIQSSEWVDVFAYVRDQLLCVHGKGLKVVAPVAGFHWRDAEASGENSMRWYRNAVGLDDATLDVSARTRLLEYNEDDVLATFTLREWMNSPAIEKIPYAGDL